MVVPHRAPKPFKINRSTRHSGAPDPLDMATTPPTDPAFWAQVRALFDQVQDLPEAQREAALQTSGLPDAVLAEVRSLLAHLPPDVDATSDAGFLAGAAAQRVALPPRAPDGSPQPVLLDDEVGAREGQQLGHWQIDALLGRGGMGEVWRAHRADGAYEGHAAIKVLRVGQDSARVLSRFAQEQRALARLNHPHIAHLLDAGRTADGLPYFVMEAVNGQPIDQACRGLPLAQRLGLFLQLADAVAHAHRNLLVHRDLKPSNVLVSTEGQVKLLDFGIAKAIDPLEGEDGNTTLAGERPFTPNYASPEQVRGEPVGTATDIYSLGVLLYEMLTGLRPYGRGATTAKEAARSVLQDEPTRPSSLSPGLVADPQWMATRRHLAGDLDNILLKALDKTLNGRYASVEAFAADVRAYLGGFPVSARSASTGYLVAKFVRRHRGVVAASVVAVLGLVVGLGAALWQAQVADAQRDVALQRFKQVRQLANQLVFKYHDQIENLPGATKARDALLKDAAGFLDDLANTAPDDLALAEELANTYYRIARLQGVDTSINTGEHAQAEVNLDKALALSKRYVGLPNASNTALMVAISMHVSKGELWQRQGRMAQAEAALREGVPLLERALLVQPVDGKSSLALTEAQASAITLYGVLARVQGSNLAAATLGRWREAGQTADKARAAADATIKSDPANVYAPDSLAFTVGEQASTRLLAGRYDEAVALFTQQVQLRDRMAAKFPDDMDFRYQRSTSRGNLARAMSAQGQHVQAREQLNQAIALAEAATAADPGNRAGALRINGLKVTGVQLHLAAGEQALAQQALVPVLAQLPAADANNFVATRLRASVLVLAARVWRATQPQKALESAREAAGLMAPARPDDDNVTRRWMLAQAQGEQALALKALGQGEAAAQMARLALQSWLATPPAEGPPPAMNEWITPLRPLAEGR
jgi:tetratricopeptide (TPR) repeat protein